MPENIEWFGFTNQSIYMWGLCGGCIKLWDFKSISNILVKSQLEVTNCTMATQ